MEQPFHNFSKKYFLSIYKIFRRSLTINMLNLHIAGNNFCKSLLFHVLLFIKPSHSLLVRKSNTNTCTHLFIFNSKTQTAIYTPLYTPMYICQSNINTCINLRYKRYPHAIPFPNFRGHFHSPETLNLHAILAGFISELP